MKFPIRVVKRPVMLAAVPLLAAVVVAPFWAPLVSKVEAAVSTLSAPSVTTGIGYAVDAPITLDSAPNGISGYEMTITLSDPAIATIDSVVVPPDFGLTYVEQVSTSQVKVMGADLSQALQGNLSGVNLVTLNLTTTKQGLSAIIISLTRLDDDSGIPILPQVVDGSLTVKKRFSDGSDGGGTGGGGKSGGKGGGPGK
ncbi:MAG: hypothetical protein O2821_00285 [Chloroflexi bacterium]|nr:hypothetical protein [Chloroflexota bacterium]MDA1226744.1 hypothetical protein [Chloroflexota bacterium]